MNCSIASSPLENFPVTFAISRCLCYNEDMSAPSLPNEVKLTPDQADAAELIRAWYLHLGTQIFVLCGYAGTGKTFLVDYVVRSLGLVAGESAAFVAPTGKAASVLIRAGTPATTVHSLIYTREEDIEVNEDGEVVSERFLRFVRRESLPKEIKLIVVDETSMVSDEVLRDILSFGVKCLFCGDPAQLPPVGGSNSLLSMPAYTLTSIVRQAENDPIVRLSQAIRMGESIPFGNFGSARILPHNALSPAERRALLMGADQIIVGTNRTRAAVNAEMRTYRGVSASQFPTDGEKLVCTLNDWGKTLDEDGDYHLVNGIIGYCYRVRKGEDGLGMLDFRADFLTRSLQDVPFDAGVFLTGQYYHPYGTAACLLSNGRLVHEDNVMATRSARVRRHETICRFEFAYAVTCHKAQGSEYDSVVVFDESRLFEDGRQWLYTAVTRAKKNLIVIR